MGLFGRKKQNTEKMTETVTRQSQRYRQRTAIREMSAWAVTAWCAVTSLIMRYPEMARVWS